MSSDNTMEELEIAEDIIELVPRFLERRGEDLSCYKTGIARVILGSFSL